MQRKETLSLAHAKGQLKSRRYDGMFSVIKLIDDSKKTNKATQHVIYNIAINLFFLINKKRRKQLRRFSRLYQRINNPDYYPRFRQ
jgi:hypothetical protein